MAIWVFQLPTEKQDAIFAQIRERLSQSGLSEDEIDQAIQDAKDSKFADLADMLAE